MTGNHLTIAAVRARALRVPLLRPMRTASGSLPDAPLVLIDLETDAGITGRASIFAYTAVALRPLVTLLENLAPLDRAAGSAQDRAWGPPGKPPCCRSAFEDPSPAA